jgi:hypothetical protein
MAKNTDALREQLLKDERVRDMIRARAYEIFEERGRTHGHDLDDWLQAENEILLKLMPEAKSKSGRRAETKTKRAARGPASKLRREEGT